MGAIYSLEGQERAVGELRQEGQARTLWGDTFVDLFLANTDFHGSMAAYMQTWLERFPGAGCSATRAPGAVDATCVANLTTDALGGLGGGGVPHEPGRVER